MPITATQHPLAQDRNYGDINLTRSGKPRKRLSHNEKLHKLDLHRPLKEVANLVHAYQQLFAYRWSNAICTRVNQPRGWYALRRKLNSSDIIRHLLGTGHPCGPQWLGARSLETTRFICLDVDCDETPAQWLENNSCLSDLDPNDRAEFAADLLARRPVETTKPCFETRCQQVEDALARLGVDAGDPNQVLIQRTPRGGVHYYVFLAHSFFVEECRDLLTEAGLRFKSGHVEFYPSTKQGLRLPFGHIPGQRHDPQRWLRFIEDYQAGRIRRFSLSELTDNLFAKLARTPPAERRLPSRRTVSRSTNHAIPTHCIVPSVHCHDSARYTQLVEHGPQSPAEAIELLQLGIQAAGTRTAVLKHLAAHFIWIKCQDATTAARLLTEWAMHTHHRSQDIQDDLAHGTNKVAKHIERLCCWYEQHRESNPNRASHSKADFTREEVEQIAHHLQPLPQRSRKLLGQFLLLFLRFAKRHGWQTANGQGWEAAIAATVIRGWDGCSGLRQKQRCDQAKELGLLEVAKHHWHNPQGKGRPTTYRLLIRIEPQHQPVLTYDEALALLANPSTVAEGKQSNNATKHDQPSTTESPDVQHRNNTPANNQSRADQVRGTVPPTLHQAITGVNLASCPRQRSPQPDAATGLPGDSTQRQHANLPLGVREVLARLPPLPATLSPAARTALEGIRLRILMENPGILAVPILSPRSAIVAE